MSWAVLSAAAYRKNLDETASTSVMKLPRNRRRRGSSRAGSARSTASSIHARSKTRTAPIRSFSKTKSGRKTPSKSIITASKSEKKKNNKKKDGASVRSSNNDSNNLLLF